MARSQVRLTVTVHDLLEGILYSAALRGINFAPFRDRTRNSQLAFDLSMWQAYEWLEYVYEQQGRKDEIRFRVRPNELHGDSPVVQDALYRQLGYAFRTWMPGDGTFECRLDGERLQQLLDGNPIDIELIRELARRFIDEYSLPMQERTWPPGFSVDG